MSPCPGPKSGALFCQLTEAQLPVRLLCYDLPHLSAGATGDLYTLRLALFRAANMGALTSKSAWTAVGWASSWSVVEVVTHLCLPIGFISTWFVGGQKVSFCLLLLQGKRLAAI